MAGVSRCGKDLHVRNWIYIPDGGERPVRDYIRLSMAWFFGLVLLSIYQQAVLYYNGVLEAIFTRNLWLLLFHHLGFVALFTVVLLPVFKFLERYSQKLAMGVVFLLMTLGLVLEYYLQSYFLAFYEPLVNPYFGVRIGNFFAGSGAWYIIPASVIAALVLLFFFQFTARTYHLMSRMYPLTLILLGLALMSHKTEKKPVNENKIQWLLAHQLYRTFETIEYEGDLEYPLMKAYREEGGLHAYFDMQATMPDIVLIVIDGLGKDVIGNEAAFKDFMPYLNTLSENSLTWNNHLSLSRDAYSSIPGILGSLPFGTEGFQHVRHGVHRQTLYSLLGKNSYQTSFHYGGNLALTKLDYMLSGDRVHRINDRQNFGKGFVPQEADQAGISPGYPDKALYQNGLSTDPSGQPQFQVFLNLSTSPPYSVPDKSEYLQKVRGIIAGMQHDQHRRKVGKNKDFFASLLYADQAIKEFMDAYREKRNYKNTIFVITGSHASRELATGGLLQPFKVPLLITSPMLEKPASFEHISSHGDLMPSLLGLLDREFLLDLPEKVSWMGQDLTADVGPREMALFRGPGQIDLLFGNHLYSTGQLYRVGPAGEENTENPVKRDRMEEQLRNFRAVNQYVVREDRLIPPAYAGYALPDAPLSRAEMVWVNSVFNGKDYDRAYQTARSLAFDGERERAKVLCRYILLNVPVHADTHILLGRIHAWEGEYAQAIRLLENTIIKYPSYADAYAALLDVYYWAGRPVDAQALVALIEDRSISDPEVEKRVERARETAASDTLDESEISSS